MPLIKGKSKRSFEKNVKTEMEAGKPQKQSLAIAFDLQRRAKAKKALGGKIDERMAAYHHEAAEEKSHRDPEAGDVMPHPHCKAHGGNAEMHSPHPACGAHKFSGGEVRDKDKDQEPQATASPSPATPAVAAGLKSIREAFGNKKAEGGIIEADGKENTEHSSVVDAVMARRRRMQEPSTDLHMDEEVITPDAEEMEMLRKRRHLAEGGEVDLEENNEEEASANPSEFDRRNREAADEDDMLDTELMDSDPLEEKHEDMIHAIRQRMRMRR